MKISTTVRIFLFGVITLGTNAWGMEAWRREQKNRSNEEQRRDYWAEKWNLRKRLKHLNDRYGTPSPAPDDTIPVRN